MPEQPSSSYPPPSAAIPIDLEQRRQEARQRLQMPPAEEMTRIAASQMESYLSPSVVPIQVVSSYFERIGARNRDVLADFLLAQAKRFTMTNGSFRALTNDKPRFLREVMPLLEARGCGVEAWVKMLRAAGQWGGI